MFLDLKTMQNDLETKANSHFQNPNVRNLEKSELGHAPKAPMKGDALQKTKRTTFLFDTCIVHKNDIMVDIFQRVKAPFEGESLPKKCQDNKISF